MNQPKIKAYWKSAALLLVVFGVQVLLFLLLLYMNVLDKGNPSVLEILGNVLISAFSYKDLTTGHIEDRKSVV